MTHPALSIITICFKNPDDVRQTLDSLAGLDTDLVEMIVVDGSPDDSCQAVVAAYGNVRTLHGPDSGKYDAMNKGTQAALGDSVLFINSGDEIASVADLNEIVRENRTALATTLIYGDCIRVANGARIIERAPPLDERNNLRFGRFASHQSFLIPRAFQLQNPYDAKLVFAADTKFLMHAFRHLPYLYLPKPIGVFTYGGVSTTSATWKSIFAQYREMVDCHELDLKERFFLARKLFIRKLLFSIRGDAGVQAAQAHNLRLGRKRL